MSFLHRIPISRKLPAIIVALCVIASLSIAAIGSRSLQANIMQQAQANFDVIVESRSSALSSWIEGISADVTNFGTDPSVVSAVSAFNASYGLMINSAGLQDAYVNNNPNPVGAKDLLNQAPESVPYHFQHGAFHPYFRQIKDLEGYYDIFLFNLEGDLVYSVFKEADFATNFVTGPYRDSGLAEVFKAAKEGAPGSLFFADFAPYAPSADAPASFLAAPVVDPSGAVIGVVAIQLPVSQIEQIMHNPTGLGMTGNIYVVGPDLTTRSGSRFDDGHTILQDVGNTPHVQMAVRGESAFLYDVIGLGGEPAAAKFAGITVFDEPWGIIGEIDLAEINQPVAAARNEMMIASGVVALISIFLGVLTSRSLVQPLGRIGKAMQNVADGHYDINLPQSDRQDEIGVLSRGLLEFRDRLRGSEQADEARATLQAEQAKVVEQLSTALSHLADGDLTHRINTAFTDDYEGLRRNYNQTVDNLNNTVGTVVGHAQGIRARADEMSAASDDLSRRTENQAATLEQTAAALDELTASVKSAADGAREVNGVVEDARADAEESEPVVKKAVGAMTEIEASSSEISQIIGVIDDIAFQTNLLALNAGVEAARAGEAGRGFAVVASEVRALAQRSSDAAKQIKGLISDSSGQVARGVDLVRQAGDVLTKIAEHINHISGLIGGIASSAGEQSTGLDEINVGVTQLDKVTQQNAAMVEETTASSHVLKADAGELSSLVTQFKLDKRVEQQYKSAAMVPVALPQVHLLPSENEPVVQAQPQPVLATRTGTGGNADIWEDF